MPGKERAVFRSPLMLAFLWTVLLFFSFAAHGYSVDLRRELDKRIGPNDSAMVTDPTGNVIYAKNENKRRVPASTLKLLTALTAFHWLGADSRFATDFFLNSTGDLVIRGTGDPMLISEEVAEICRQLASRLSTIEDLVLDDSYFSDPLTVSGVTNSSQPYDAPNGALCVNFNTVFFKTEGGHFVSAEPQTPLLPFVFPKIRSTGLKMGRITLTHQRRETTQYAGELFRYFLEKNGMIVKGRIRIDSGGEEETTERILHHPSSMSVSEIVSGLMAHSNNFIANQLLIASGAAAFGPPGNLEKAVASMVTYAEENLGLTDVKVVEGSGISRKNMISANQMIVVLDHFLPYAELMNRDGRERFKTGTLHGIRTRVGYIRSTDGGLFRYVVMLNTPGKTTDAVMTLLRANLP